MNPTATNIFPIRFWFDLFFAYSKLTADRLTRALAYQRIGYRNDGSTDRR